MPEQTAGWARPYRCRVAHWFDLAGQPRLALPVCGAMVYMDSVTVELAAAPPAPRCERCLRKLGEGPWAP